MLPNLLTPQMVNDYFKRTTGKGLAKSKLYDMFRQKDFPSFRVGKRIFVREDRFLEWLDKQSKLYY